jgi:hypothetical protein
VTDQPTLATLTEEQLAALHSDATAYRSLKDRFLAASTPSEDLERIPLAEHTETTLTELYDLLEDTEHDRAETREAAQAMFKAWEWHRNVLGGVARAVTAIRNQMRVSSRDWATDRADAYLWAVLIGWDNNTLEEVAAKHRWREERMAYVREMRALLAPITDQQKEPTE